MRYEELLDFLPKNLIEIVCQYGSKISENNFTVLITITGSEKNSH